MHAPLTDVRVLEVDGFIAAPSAAALLADMGADVIKVEPLSGDPNRGLGRPLKCASSFAGYDFQFDVDNRGKRGIAIALDTAQGQALIHRLMQSANIFLCNLLRHRQEKFGLDPDTLLQLKPDLVHATLTGYGTQGPDAWRPGYDVTAFFGRSGLYDGLREGDQGIVPHARPAQGDHTAGLALTSAILAALRLAERTGEGQVVETSLYETAIWTLATDYSATVIDKAPARRRTRFEQLTPMTNRYPCGDNKWLVINMLDANAWERLCRVLGRADWLTDERFATGKSRYRHMAELVAGVDETLASRSRDEWGAIFDREGVIWGPVLSFDEVVDDPQAKALGVFPEIDHPKLGAYATIGAPMRFHTADVRPRGPAPELGEHTLEALSEAGLSTAEIDQLRADRVIR